MILTDISFKNVIPSLCNPLYSYLCIIPAYPQVTIILLFSATGLGLGERQRQTQLSVQDPRITCVLAEKGRCPWAVKSETAQPSLDLLGNQLSYHRDTEPCWPAGKPCRHVTGVAGHTLADLEESWLSYYWKVCSRYSTACPKAVVTFAIATAERCRPCQDLDLTLA